MLTYTGVHVVSVNYIYYTSHTQQNDEKVKDVISKTRGHPRRRLQYIYDLAKVKSLCEGGDKMEKKFDPLAERGEDPTLTVSS